MLKDIKSRHTRNMIPEPIPVRLADSTMIRMLICRFEYKLHVNTDYHMDGQIFPKEDEKQQCKSQD